MAKTSDPHHFVVVDDEMQHIIWLIDYLEASDLRVITASTANDAIEIISKEIYRGLVIDLNIPVFDPLRQNLVTHGAVYGKYPGLYLAKYARNMGYRDRQVLVYSAHKDAAVAEQAKILGCTYIIKGRPREIKDEIDLVIKYDPTH